MQIVGFPIFKLAGTKGYILDHIPLKNFKLY